MISRLFTATLATLALATAGGALQAQTFERRATMRGQQHSGSGKCTLEVLVDGAAQVEIRGDMAYLRNLNGQQPQWRRFECDSVMPPNPTNFRFTGVDGRGRQTLVRDPRNGAAVVEIQDPDNGQEAYTFDITWGANGGYQNSGNPVYPNGGYAGNNGGYPDRGGSGARRFTAEQAVQVCEDNIREQARRQFRTNEVFFRQTALDDRPGRGDWVVGSVEARTGFGPPQHAHFSCSVNFDTGRVRSAQLEPTFAEDRGRNNNQLPAAAIQNCQPAVEDRLRNDGYRRPVFGSVRADDQPGRNDWVVGSVDVNGRYGQESLRFSCSVDLRDGDVRSVDLNTRR